MTDQIDHKLIETLTFEAVRKETMKANGYGKKRC